LAGAPDKLSPRTTNTPKRSVTTSPPPEPEAQAGGGNDEEYIRLAAEDYSRARGLVPEKLAGAAHSIRRRLIEQGGMTDLDRQQLAALRARQEEVRALRARVETTQAETTAELILMPARPTTEDEPKIWRQAREYLQAELPASTYSLWIEPLICVSAGGDTLELVGPDQFFCSWVAENYQATIQETLGRAGGPRQIRLITEAK
jgi:hypothetical protein